MLNPPYPAPVRTLPWHKSAVEANRNHSIVVGKLYKSLKGQNPTKAWGPDYFFLAIGYSTRLQARVRPPPAEQSVEDQPFFLAQRNDNVPQTRVDLTMGSYSLTATQITDHEALNRKAAIAG